MHGLNNQGWEAKMMSTLKEKMEIQIHDVFVVKNSWKLANKRQSRWKVILSFILVKFGGKQKITNSV